MSTKVQILFILSLCCLHNGTVAFCKKQKGKEKDYKIVSPKPTISTDVCDTFSNSQYVFLIFENTFNDSIICKQNNGIIFNGIVKTNKSLSVVVNKIKVSPDEEVEIYFINRKEKLRINVTNTYRYVYINRANSLYDVLFSHCENEYY